MLNRGRNDVLALRARFERGMKRGVVRFRSTTGKHDFARFAAEKGGDLLLIRDAMGHASINTTTIYTHISTNKRRQDLARLLAE